MSCVRHRGFTLLEVLIALAIIAIACTAIIKVVNDGVLVTTRVQEDAVAGWVSANVMANLQNGLQPLPDNGGTVSGRENMLNHIWRWVAKDDVAASQHYIKKIHLSVFMDQQKKPIRTLTVFVWSGPQGFILQ